ncbi:uncharacterized protein LOC144662531 isoform X1 [Oculina patagonica]
MATATFSSTKDTTNYARLCRLLVDVGSQALRDTFDKIYPPATLHAVLSSHSVRSTLTRLYTGRRKVLNAIQWGKLYPVHTLVSSSIFDVTLLTVLLRNICSLSPPVAGWDALPPPADTSIADDIARVKYYRNTVYGHASQASVDDTSFNTYWPEIREALVRLGGPSYRADIDNLEHDCMDPDIEEHYRELMKQWKKDDDSIKDKLEEMEESIKESLKQTKIEVERIGSEMKEVKGRLDNLTASLEENKDEERVRDEFNKMKSEIGNISGKLDSLKTSRQETKDEDPFDPSELIEGIRQLYETREGWLSPFPWCEEFHFHLNDIFTRLKMISRKKTRGTATDEIVNMSAIFKPHEKCLQPRTVLIEGNPGMGKTTYCKKLVYDWATGKQEAEDSFPRFEIVLLLKCRDIKFNVWEAIDDQLLPRDIQECARERFFNFIRRNQSRVLLLLDGLDELPAGKLPVYSELIQGRVLPKCHLVATARHEAGIKVRKYCDSILEIEGFTENDAEKFIFKYFTNRWDLAFSLLFKLDKDENLKSMMKNPLNTALLCLVCEEFQGNFPKSRTQLYLEITNCVLRRYRKRKGLSETNEDLIEVYKTQLRHLGWIALSRLLEGDLDFDERELGKYASDLSEFGFLSMQPGGSKLRPCRRYAFLHKSFQEFFAAYFLNCQLLNKEITPDDLASDPRYFSERKQVLLFSFGIVSAQCEETAVALMASITAQVNNHESLDSVDVALDCISECKSENSAVHVTLFQVFLSHFELKKIWIRHKFILGDAEASSLAEAIKVNTTMTELSLGENYISDTGVAFLAEAIKVNSTMTRLSLGGNYISNIGVAFLAEAIKVNETLSEFSLRTHSVDDAGATSIAEAIKVNKTLSELHLGNNYIGDAGAASLAEAIKVNKTLSNLQLGCNNVGATGAMYLAEAIKVNETLSELNLCFNSIGDTGTTFLAAAMKVNTSLTKLDLWKNKISDRGATLLAEALKVNKTLSVLHLWHNDIGDAGATSLADAIKINTTLTTLGLWDNVIAVAGASSLAEAIKVNTKLTKLNLTGNSVGDAGASSLANAMKLNTTLTELDLEENNIGDAGTACLAEAIKVNTTLTKLNLEENNIGDAGATFLAEAIKVNSILSELNLENNSIGDVGAISLAEAIKDNTTLTELDLWDNLIGDASAASFAEAIKVNTTLTCLDLRRNNIGDIGVALLAEAFEVNKSLTRLDVRENDIADDVLLNWLRRQ